MIKKAATILAAGLVLLCFLSALPAEAQVGTPSRDKQQAKPVGPTAPGMKGQQQEQQGERPSQRNAWLQGDEAQQEQLTGCFQLSATLSQHARDIRKLLLSTEVNWKEVQNQHEDLNRGIQLLTEKHDQFAMGLNNGQQSWWERQLKEIMAIQMYLHDRTETIGRELKEEKPGSAPMAIAYTDLDGQFRKWNSYYGQIGADMNIQLEQRSAPGRIRGLPGAQNPGR